MKLIRRPMILCTLLGSVALAAAARDGAPKLTVKVGDVLKYKRDFKFKLTGQDIEISGDLNARVEKIDDAGLVSIEYAASNSFLSVGQVKSAMETAPITKIFHSDGSLYGLHGDNTSAEAYRLETLSSIKLPTVPLAKDLAWTWDIPADSKLGIVKSSVDFKVLGDETIAGIDSWKLSRKAAEQAGDKPMTGDGTVWISKAGNYMVKANDTWTNAPIPGAHDTISGTFSFDLQP